MKITVNGKSETQTGPRTLTGLLEAKGIDPKTVVIEHNGDIPDRAAWAGTEIADGDVIEILKFMGGG